MQFLWNKLARWLESKGGTTHVLATAIAGLVAVYGISPSFREPINHLYGLMPMWVHDLVAAGLALWLIYRNPQKSPVAVFNPKEIQNLK